VGISNLFERDPAEAFVGPGHEEHRASAMGSNFLIEASNVFLERGDAVLGEFWDVVLQDDSIVVSLLDAFMHRGQSVEDT
jgi:hypothetical protein